MSLELQLAYRLVVELVLEPLSLTVGLDGLTVSTMMLSLTAWDIQLPFESQNLA